MPSQPNHPLGQWACDQGYKRIVAIAADYAFGYEQTGGFQQSFEDCGGKIVQKIWVPLGTKDFGPYIPTLKSDVDAIFTLMVGPMSLQFPKQLRASGNKKPIVGGGTSYDEFALPFMGDEVIGDVSALQYSAAMETPANEKFVKDYRAKYGKVPSYYSEVQLRGGANGSTDAGQAQRQISGTGRVHQDHGDDQARRAARAGAARSRDQEPDPEHLHQEGREEEDVRLSERTSSGTR